MNVLLIGATARASRELRALAPSGVRVSDETRSVSPDWVLVATGSQRAQAIEAHALPPYRVVEFPAIASDVDPLSHAEVRALLEKMAGIGAARPLLSSIGIAIVRPFVRRRVRVDAAQTSGPPEIPETGLIMSGVPGRVPSGATLDALLAERARGRAKRFSALAVRSTANRTS